MKFNTMKQIALASSTVALLITAGIAFAATDTSGYVQSLQHYGGHAGILVKLDGVMIDPNGCGRTDWYIMPDSNPRASFVHAMLLSAQASQRQVWITLDGCLDGMPQILAIRN